jgi:hypothetical protein
MVVPSEAPADCRWRESQSSTLIDDVRLAEDLAIRFADARGSVANAGAPTPSWRDVRLECEAALFAGVAREHRTSLTEITRVRDELGNRQLDAWVHPPMGLLALLLIAGASTKLKRRYGPDERIRFAAATVFWSIQSAVLVVAAGHLWSAALEMYRIGNGHLSYRASRIPWSHQWTPVFLTVVVVFVLFAWMQFRATVREARGRGDANSASAGVGPP